MTSKIVKRAGVPNFRPGQRRDKVAFDYRSTQSAGTPKKGFVTEGYRSPKDVSTENADKKVDPRFTHMWFDLYFDKKTGKFLHVSSEGEELNQNQRIFLRKKYADLEKRRMAMKNAIESGAKKDWYKVAESYYSHVRNQKKGYRRYSLNKNTGLPDDDDIMGRPYNLALPFDNKEFNDEVLQMIEQTDIGPTALVTHLMSFFNDAFQLGLYDHNGALTSQFATFRPFAIKAMANIAKNLEGGQTKENLLKAKELYLKKRELLMSPAYHDSLKSTFESMQASPLARRKSYKGESHLGESRKLDDNAMAVLINNSVIHDLAYPPKGESNPLIEKYWTMTVDADLVWKRQLSVDVRDMRDAMIKRSNDFKEELEGEKKIALLQKEELLRNNPSAQFTGDPALAKINEKIEKIDSTIKYGIKLPTVILDESNKDFWKAYNKLDEDFTYYSDVGEDGYDIADIESILSKIKINEKDWSPECNYDAAIKAVKDMFKDNNPTRIDNSGIRAKRKITAKMRRDASLRPQVYGDFHRDDMASWVMNHAEKRGVNLGDVDEVRDVIDSLFKGNYVDSPVTDEIDMMVGELYDNFIMDPHLTSKVLDYAKKLNIDVGDSNSVGRDIINIAQGKPAVNPLVSEIVESLAVNEGAILPKRSTGAGKLYGFRTLYPVLDKGYLGGKIYDTLGNRLMTPSGIDLGHERPIPEGYTDDEYRTMAEGYEQLDEAEEYLDELREQQRVEAKRLKEAARDAAAAPGLKILNDKQAPIDAKNAEQQKKFDSVENRAVKLYAEYLRQMDKRMFSNAEDYLDAAQKEYDENPAAVLTKISQGMTRGTIRGIHNALGYGEKREFSPAEHLAVRTGKTVKEAQTMIDNDPRAAYNLMMLTDKELESLMTKKYMEAHPGKPGGEESARDYVVRGMKNQPEFTFAQHGLDMPNRFRIPADFQFNDDTVAELYAEYLDEMNSRRKNKGLNYLSDDDIKAQLAKVIDRQIGDDGYYHHTFKNPMDKGIILKLIDKDVIPINEKGMAGINGLSPLHVIRRTLYNDQVKGDRNRFAVQADKFLHWQLAKEKEAKEKGAPQQDTPVEKPVEEKPKKKPKTGSKKKGKKEEGGDTEGGTTTVNVDPISLNKDKSKSKTKTEEKSKTGTKKPSSKKKTESKTENIDGATMDESTDTVKRTKSSSTDFMNLVSIINKSNSAQIRAMFGTVMPVRKAKINLAHPMDWDRERMLIISKDARETYAKLRRLIQERDELFSKIYDKRVFLESEGHGDLSNDAELKKLERELWHYDSEIRNDVKRLNGIVAHDHTGEYVVFKDQFVYDPDNLGDTHVDSIYTGNKRKYKTIIPWKEAKDRFKLVTNSKAMSDDAIAQIYMNDPTAFMKTILEENHGAISDDSREWLKTLAVRNRRFNENVDDPVYGGLGRIVNDDGTSDFEEFQKILDDDAKEKKKKEDKRNEKIETKRHEIEAGKALYDLKAGEGAFDEMVKQRLAAEGRNTASSYAGQRAIMNALAAQVQEDNPYDVIDPETLKAGVAAPSALRSKDGYATGYRPVTNKPAHIKTPKSTGDKTKTPADGPAKEPTNSGGSTEGRTRKEKKLTPKQMDRKIEREYKAKKEQEKTNRKEFIQDKTRKEVYDQLDQLLDDL